MSCDRNRLNPIIVTERPKKAAHWRFVCLVTRTEAKECPQNE